MKTIYIILLCCIITRGYSQLNSFEKVFEANENIYGSFVQQTKDGGYILCGGNDSLIHLIKTDASGNISWRKVITDTVHFGSGYYKKSGAARCIKETSDGGYIISGYIEFPIGYGAYTVKTDNQGEKIWSQKVEPSGYAMIAYAVHEFPNVGYIFNYYNNGELSANSFGYYRTSLTGENLQNTYIANSGSLVNNFEKTADNSILTMSYNDIDNVKYIQKMTMNGSVWKKETSLDLVAIKETGNGFIGAACTRDNNNAKNINLIKYNQNGDSLSGCLIPADEAEYAVDVVVVPNNGGYCILSNTGTTYSAGRNVRLSRLDQNGTVMWETILGEDNAIEYGANLIYTADGGFALTGNKEKDGKRMIYFVKVNSNGKIEYSGTTGMSEDKKSNKILITPNPFKDSATLHLPDDLMEDSMIFELFDITGKACLIIRPGETRTQINTGSLPAGVYFYRLRNQKGIIQQGKLVID